ncbi:MAG: DUF3168 domain-containing protein [Pseudomonadota bacterium]
MSEPADLEAGLVAYLAEQAAVTALVGARIYAGEMHPDETKNQPRPAIVLKSSGGVSLTGESRLDHDTQRIDVFAFGATPREAARVMRVVDQALRTLERGTWALCVIHWVNRAGGSSQGREPGTEWPRHFQSYQAMHGLTQVPA